MKKNIQSTGDYNPGRNNGTCQVIGNMDPLAYAYGDVIDQLAGLQNEVSKDDDPYMEGPCDWNEEPIIGDPITRKDIVDPFFEDDLPF